jgi:cathepsin K
LGPVTITFKASRDFLFYSKGIYTLNNCHNGNSINIALLIIGYGEEKGLKYWIV